MHTVSWQISFLSFLSFHNFLMTGGSVLSAQMAKGKKAVPLEFILVPHQPEGAAQLAVCQWDFKEPACGKGIGGKKAADDGDAQTGFRCLEQCLGVAAFPADVAGNAFFRQNTVSHFPCTAAFFPHEEGIGLAEFGKGHGRRSMGTNGSQTIRHDGQ